MESRLPSLRNNSSIRLFWGIKPAAELNSPLAAWQREARLALPRARWIPSEKVHLTLAFLGQRPLAELDSILTAGLAVASGHAAFGLRTTTIGGFPSLKTARVLWLGLEPEPSLASLAVKLRLAMEPFGCGQDPFRPHLTLARFKPPAVVPSLSDLEPLLFPVQEIHLFQSLQRADGPKYLSLGQGTLRVSGLPVP